MPPAGVMRALRPGRRKESKPWEAGGETRSHFALTRGDRGLAGFPTAASHTVRAVPRVVVVPLGYPRSTQEETRAWQEVHRRMTAPPGDPFVVH